jgi:hypothetical protein
MSALTLAMLSELTEMNQIISSNVDPKAVGSHLAHRPLSRRLSNPSSPDGSLFADSLTQLNKKLNQISNSNSNSNHSLLQLAVSAQLNEVKRSHRKLDRSQSEPVERAQLAAAAAAAAAGGVIPANSSRYKTELCRPYEENGTCKYGDKCQFAHGFNELRSLVRHPKYKTELCRTFHTIGFCPYGPRCHFIHNAEEARNHGSSSSSSTSSSPAPPGHHHNHKSSRNSHHHHKFTGGSTADSPSPPSSLSESPTAMNTFFSEDLFPGNPFSPASSSANNAFLFGSDFAAPLFGRSHHLSGGSGGSTAAAAAGMLPELGQQYGAFRRQMQLQQQQQRLFNDLNADHHQQVVQLEGSSPSPVDSLSSDLDSLSLGSSSSGPSPPPPAVSSPMDPTSRALRLPIFSRISETLNED